MELLKQIGTEFTLVYIAIIFIVFIFLFIKIQKEKNNLNLNINSFNYYPSLLSSLGVLGTFIGITIGLFHFNPANIDGSIENLLNGLKFAFGTSIVGMICSSILAWRINRILDTNKQQEQITKSHNELLNKMLDKLISIDDNQKEFFKNFHNMFSEQNKDNYNFLSKNIENLFSNLEKQQKKLATDIISSMNNNNKDYNNHLDIINQNLIEHNHNYRALETKLNGIQILLDNKFEETKNSVTDFSKLYSNNTETLKNTLVNIMQNAKEELSNVLSKNNTEALVNVMKKATEEFSKSMSIIIEKLVKENFAQLNKAVENMLDWQKENKSEIEELIEQYKLMESSFKATSSILYDITSNINDLKDNTKELVDDNGKLTQLIKELNKVLIEENNFTIITNKLNDNIKSLEITSRTVEQHSLSCINSINSSNQNAQSILDKCLKEINNAVNATGQELEKTIYSINKLYRISKKQEISLKDLIIILNSIKPDNIEFWKEVRNRLEEGLSIVRASSTELSNNLQNITDNLNKSFINQLNAMLKNLDTCIITAIEQKKKK